MDGRQRYLFGDYPRSGLVYILVFKGFLIGGLSPYEHGRTRQGAGGGATALSNSGKTVGKIRAKQEECVKFRQINPSAPLNQRVPRGPYAYEVLDKELSVVE